MPILVNTTLHALLVATWTVTGYCLCMLAAHPCAAHAAWSAVLLANACSLLRAVWPRVEVRCG